MYEDSLNCFSHVLQEDRLHPSQILICLPTCLYSMRSEKKVSSPIGNEKDTKAIISTVMDLLYFLGLDNSGHAGL
jgi:hypothetical protein